MMKNYFKKFGLIASLLFATASFSQYCAPTVPMTASSYLNNLKLSSTSAAAGDILNRPSANVGYENITDTDVTFITNTAYTFNFGVADAGETTHKRIHVWIDMNADGDFDDSGELIFSWSAANTSSDLKFSNKGIGPVITEGETRMRVAMVAADGAIAAINPCDNFTGGEVEDYKIKIYVTAPPAYCMPTIPVTASSFLNNLKISTTNAGTGDVLNRASANAGYENITDTNFSLVTNTAYKFNFGVADAGLTSHKRIHVWIDMNRDGDFDDAGELTFSWSGANTGADLAFGNKNIGPVIEAGETRMRVALVAANSAIAAINPCDDFTGGEVKDYKINLVIPVPEYCVPNVPVSTTSFINNMKISTTNAGTGDVLNQASTNMGYENITSTNPTLVTNTSYKFNIGVGDAGQTTHKRIHVWIDMNGDKDFDDAGELMFSWNGANTSADLAFGNKNIGSVIVAGETRMRVALVAADAVIGAINPCDDFTGGEVKDYKINLEIPVDCTSPNLSASTTSFINYFKIDGGGLLNHTSGNVGYENITDSNVALVAEGSYAFNFGVGNPSAGSNKRVHIWIDKNQDGDFEDTGENVFEWSGGNTTTDLGFTNKSIGAFTMLGTTKMRIAMRSSNSAIPAMSPCDTFTDGEIIDFSVVISAPIPPLTELTAEIDLDLYVGDQIPFSTNGTPHTYRIPSLVTSNAGTLLAITDARYEDASDVPGVIDMFVRRSTDNGATWGNSITIKTDHGGDACTVVDKTTGRIFVFYAYSEFQTIFGSNGDPNNQNTLRSQYKYSDDDGLTWSAAVDLTASLYRTGEKSFWASAGTGIQLRNGTLVIPIAVVRNDNKIFGGLLYSTDNGATWNRSQNNSFINFDENTIVELNDGRIMVNARNHYGTKTRLVTYTDDLGTTWTPYTFDATLIDPISQGNILRYTSTKDGYDKDRILFSNSGNKGSRSEGTLRVSYDEGQTWAHSKLYQTGFSAYSSMTILPDGKIGVLYETNGYKTIRFRRFSLNDLTDSNDTYTLDVEKLDTSDNGTKIYPNPVTSVLNVSSKVNSNIQIYNALGKVVYNNKVSLGNKEIDLTFLSKGIYFVKIKNEIGIRNFKIVKK